MSSITLADQLTSHRKRRQALEQLISFARQITSAGDSMEALQYVTRPSQTGDRKRFSFLSEMAHHLEAQTTDLLKERLSQTDKLLIAETELFLHLAALSEEEFFARHQGAEAEEIQHSIQMLEKRLQAFRRKAQTNVAIRLVLDERGAQLKALHLPISQEQLSVEVLELRQKEQKCRDKIIREVNSLVTETNHLLSQPLYPESVVQAMQQNRARLQEALLHLQAGKSLEDLPFHIEVHEEVRTLPEPFEAQDAPAVSEPLLPSQIPLPATEESPTGFLRVFSRWLNSGMEVSWKDAGQQPRPPEERRSP